MKIKETNKQKDYDIIDGDKDIEAYLRQNTHLHAYKTHLGKNKKKKARENISQQYGKL